MNKIDYQRIWTETNIELAKSRQYGDVHWNSIWERRLREAIAKAKERKQ